MRGAFGLVVLAAVPLPALLQQEVARHSAISLDELNAITLRAIMPALQDHFFKSQPLLAYLRDNQMRAAVTTDKAILVGWE